MVIQIAKPTEKIAVPIEEISAMKDIIFSPLRAKFQMTFIMAIVAKVR
jgi:hypothetical protein